MQHAENVSDVLTKVCTNPHAPCTWLLCCRWAVEQDVIALQQQLNQKKREAEALRQELLNARSQVRSLSLAVDSIRDLSLAL